MEGARLMHCTPTANGFVCGPAPRRTRCVGCIKLTIRARLRLCDARIKGSGGRTCDAPVCVDCTTQPAPDKDLCPHHAAQWRKLNAAR